MSSKRKVKVVHQQLSRDIPTASEAEAAQLPLLADYATAVLSALNWDGTTPFDFAAVQAGADLDEVAQSLERPAKKGKR